jgi:hypothetical protein
MGHDREPERDTQGGYVLDRTIRDGRSCDDHITLHTARDEQDLTGGHWPVRGDVPA